MIKKYYETIFEVTETCQNGNERRIRKAVLSQPFRNGRHVPEEERVGKGIAVLESMHYYDIKYIETKTKTLIFMEEAGA